MMWAFSPNGSLEHWRHYSTMADLSPNGLIPTSALWQLPPGHGPTSLTSLINGTETSQPSGQQQSSIMLIGKPMVPPSNLNPRDNRYISPSFSTRKPQWSYSSVLSITPSTANVLHAEASMKIVSTSYDAPVPTKLRPAHKLYTTSMTTLQDTIPLSQWLIC